MPFLKARADTAHSPSSSPSHGLSPCFARTRTLQERAPALGQDSTGWLWPSPLPQEATFPARFTKELPRVTARSDASSVVQAASPLFPPLLPRRWVCKTRNVLYLSRPSPETQSVWREGGHPSPSYSNLPQRGFLSPGRKRQRPRSRGPGDGVLRAPSRQRSQTSRLRGLQLPEGSATAANTPPAAEPNPSSSASAFAWAWASERPVTRLGKSLQPPDVRAGVSCLSEALKASKRAEDAISCSRYHPGGHWERADVIFPSRAGFHCLLSQDVLADAL